MITKSNLENFQKISDTGQLNQEIQKQWHAELAKNNEIENNMANISTEIAAKYDSMLSDLTEVHSFITVAEMRAYERSQAAIYNGMPILGGSVKITDIWRYIL